MKSQVVSAECPNNIDSLETCVGRAETEAKCAKTASDLGKPT